MALIIQLSLEIQQACQQQVVGAIAAHLQLRGGFARSQTHGQLLVAQFQFVWLVVVVFLRLDFALQHLERAAC